MSRAFLITLSDPARFAVVLQRGLNARFDGSQARAAKTIGINQSTISRLLTCRSPKLRRRTWDRLLGAMPDDISAELRAAAIDTNTRAALDRYQSWVRTRLKRVEAERGSLMPLGFATSAELQQTDIAWLLKAAREVCGDEIGDFVLAMLKDRRHDFARVKMALVRIVEPLAEARESGLVEVVWSELTPKERRDFVLFGLRRERILLKREALLVRIRGAHRAAALREALRPFDDEGRPRFKAVGRVRRHAR